MRALLPATVLLTALAGASFQARASDHNAPISRGAFATPDAADAAACMRLCAEDALCMAWTFHPTGVCELRAAVAAAAAPPGSTSGVSGRAPASLQRLVETPEEPPPEPPKADPAASALAHNDASDALLGGPREAGSGLRPRHGGSR